MGILVGQLIKILEQFDQDRDIMIHTFKQRDCIGYFVQKRI